jgi:hypothetical protein
MWHLQASRRSNYVYGVNLLPWTDDRCVCFKYVIKLVSSVGIFMGPAWKAGVQFPAGTTNSSLLHSVQTGSGAQPAYDMCRGGSGECWGRSVKLTIPLHPVPRLRMAELHLHSLIRLDDVVLNWLSNGATLPLPYSWFRINVQCWQNAVLNRHKCRTHSEQRI